MTLKTIVGLDHVVVVVRDLDAAADAWRRLGFTVSPRGTHSPLLGTGNYTIMFEHDYIELLGVLTETEFNAPSRALLARHGEGIERAAFTTTDAAAGVAELRTRGLPGIGPVDFGRPVTLPDGRQTQAEFKVFLWPAEEAPGGMRIFACQHLTPEAVWIPELLEHANTARRIERVEILSSDPKMDATHMARLIDAEVRPEPDGAFAVPSGQGRADFVFLTREGLAQRHPGAPLGGLSARGAAILVIAVHDLQAAGRASGPDAVTMPGRVYVPASAATGVLLCFLPP